MSLGYRTPVKIQRLERLLGCLLNSEARLLEVAWVDALTSVFKVSFRLIEPISTPLHIHARVHGGQPDNVTSVAL